MSTATTTVGPEATVLALMEGERVRAPEDFENAEKFGQDRAFAIERPSPRTFPGRARA